MGKYWANSKGMWLAAAVTALGLIQTNFQTYPLEPRTQGMITLAIGIAIGVVRAITGEPIVASKAPKP